MVDTVMWDGFPPSFRNGRWEYQGTDGRWQNVGRYMELRVRLPEEFTGDRVRRSHVGGTRYATVTFSNDAWSGTGAAHSEAAAQIIAEYLHSTYEEYGGDGRTVRYLVSVPASDTVIDETVRHDDGTVVRVCDGILEFSMFRTRVPDTPRAVEIADLRADQYAALLSAVRSVPVPRPAALPTPVQFLERLWRGAAYGWAATQINERVSDHTMKILADTSYAERDRYVRDKVGKPAWREDSPGPVSIDDLDRFASPRADVHWHYSVIAFADRPDARRTKAGGKVQRRVANAIALDIDPPEGMNRDDVALCTAYLDQCEAALLLPPSAVINSGGGRHYFWILGEPVALSDNAEKDAYEKMWQRWRALHILPDAVKPFADDVDLSRMLRLPGSMNCKPAYITPRPVMITEYHEDRVYSVQTLTEIIESVEARRMAARPAAAAPERAFDNLGPLAASADGAILVPSDPGRVRAHVWERYVVPQLDAIRMAGDGSRISTMLGKVHYLGGVIGAVGEDVLPRDDVVRAVQDAIDSNVGASASKQWARGSTIEGTLASGIGNPFVCMVMTASSGSATLQRTAAAAAPSEVEPLFEMAEPGWSLGLPPPQWIVPNILARSGYHLVIGQNNSHKTWFVMAHMFEAIILEYEQKGREARVYYIATEEDRNFDDRVMSWCEGNPQHADLVKRCFRQLVPKRARFDLLSAEYLQSVIDHANRDPMPTLGFVIDTLRASYHGPEDSSEIAARINQNCRELSRLTDGEPFVVVVHHEGLATGRGRGSTAVNDNTTLTLRLHKDVRDRERLLVSVLRCKIASEPAYPLEYTIVYHPLPTDPLRTQRGYFTFDPVVENAAPASWDIDEKEREVLMRIANTPGGMIANATLGPSYRSALRTLSEARRRDSRPALIARVDPEGGARKGAAYEWTLTTPGREFIVAVDDESSF